MKKKVMTLTFHQANNYGAALQAYALQKILETRYDTQIINYYCSSVYDAYRLIRYDKKSKGQLIRSIGKLPFYILRYMNFKKFRNNLKISKKYQSLEELKDAALSADAYIVGSDQVWNPLITAGFDAAYFLDFGSSSTKRISYAPSCGDIHVINEHMEEFKAKIQNIDRISVRESNMKSIIENLTGKNVFVAMDPTLLLEKEHWMQLISKRRLIKEKYIAVYTIGKMPDLLYDVVNELSRQTGYPIAFFERNDKEKKFKCKKKSYYSCGPTQFVQILNDAEFVITTSFHGLAMSTILNKNFFVVLNMQPDRLLSILSDFKLENRIITDISQLNSILQDPIDWDQVNKKLKSERKKSLNWLFDSIEK